MNPLIPNKIVTGDATNFFFWQVSPDLILCDPPFKPAKVQYKQIRKENKHELAEITTPANPVWDLFWLQVCQNAQLTLKQSGWFIYKCDAYTFAESYPVTKLFFRFQDLVVLDKIAIGLGYYIRKRHELLAIFRPLNSVDSFCKYTPVKKEEKTESEQKWHGNFKGSHFPSVLTIPAFNLGNLHDEMKQNPKPISIKLQKGCGRKLLIGSVQFQAQFLTPSQDQVRSCKPD
jgi:hypothetical protein